MRQSVTAPDTESDWMDQERATRLQYNPDLTIVTPSPWGRLTGMRSALLRRVVDAVHSRGRVPQVCLYALAFGGCVPQASFDAAAAYADRQSWRVKAGSAFTDPAGAGALESRQGWARVRQQIRGGHATGVVVITTDVITADPVEYERELDWFDRNSGFIAVAVPEVAGRR
ncbi:hypothetical protein ACIOJ9_29580 [Streptomyces sp. NPDC088175]|uniref:hypothetical protein n=1 Tax=unclassified Streptomyces TaxID=2593676 RepID=UPI0037F80F73